ncbi:hypothetical protein B0T16DRAFT_419744 [Cercophora newfieldiana]|uniref:Methyltransferase domain-containing protein n=1 Tax=Cercophora newfieldiana TaxID=92897 RepID=A0AA40CK48_9PEZI|nr:hypothetical protein B0T16DRAFT_419744 [Cercophora newfieldiana]
MRATFRAPHIRPMTMDPAPKDKGILDCSTPRLRHAALPNSHKTILPFSAMESTIKTMDSGLLPNGATCQSDAIEIVTDTPGTSLRPIPSITEESFYSGRQYHHYRPGRYLLPNDTAEQEREEVKHLMLLQLTDGAHFLAPIAPSNLRKVIDLGTGTGTWAMEVGERFPSAEVTGTDLSPIQPD